MRTLIHCFVLSQLLLLVSCNSMDESFRMEIREVFNEEIEYIEIHPGRASLEAFKIYDKQKIEVVRRWLLNAQAYKNKGSASEMTIYPKLVIKQKNEKPIVFEVTEPLSDKVYLRYKSYHMVAKRYPNLKKINLWIIELEKLRSDANQVDYSIVPTDIIN